MMKNDSFCAFILTHGRAHNVVTDTTLRKCGYTGPIYYLIDDEDDQAEDYIRKYGKDKVVVFNKDEAKQLFDPMDNFNIHGCIVYARNWAFIEAKRMGYKNFIQLDDDYTTFEFRYAMSNGKLGVSRMEDLDAVLDVMVEFLNATPTRTIALCQGGDFVGGVNSGTEKNLHLKRKAMNSFIFKTDEEPLYFRGTLNEDVNSYVNYGNLGRLYFQHTMLSLKQKTTQANDGGITDLYKAVGTYTKSFYSVMGNPSCVRIACMGNTNYRIHHSIKWKYAVPQILAEIWKKK